MSDQCELARYRRQWHNAMQSSIEYGSRLVPDTYASDIPILQFSVSHLCILTLSPFHIHTRASKNIYIPIGICTFVCDTPLSRESKRRRWFEKLLTPSTNSSTTKKNDICMTTIACSINRILGQNLNYASRRPIGVFSYACTQKN